MPAIYSQARADLYDFAFNLPAETALPTANMKPHLADLLRVRICPDQPIPTNFLAGEVRDYLAPTFGEARDIALYREATLQWCLDNRDAGHKYVQQKQLSVEIVDYLYDLVEPHAREVYILWDVIKALRQDFDEQREEAQRNSYSHLPKWQKWSIKGNDDDDDPIPF